MYISAANAFAYLLIKTSTFFSVLEPDKMVAGWLVRLFVVFFFFSVYLLMMMMMMMSDGVTVLAVSFFLSGQKGGWEREIARLHDSR